MKKRFIEVDDGLDFSIKHIESGEMFYDCESIVGILNELAEENTMLKGHIKELYRLVKFDVDNGIEVYPKVLLEYIVNILKIIGDVE